MTAHELTKAAEEAEAQAANLRAAADRLDGKAKTYRQQAATAALKEAHPVNPSHEVECLLEEQRKVRQKVTQAKRLGHGTGNNEALLAIVDRQLEDACVA